MYVGLLLSIAALHSERRVLCSSSYICWISHAPHFYKILTDFATLMPTKVQQRTGTRLLRKRIQRKIFISSPRRNESGCEMSAEEEQISMNVNYTWQLLSASNPTFRVYVTHSSFVVLKVLLLGLYTGILRFKKHVRISLSFNFIII